MREKIILVIDDDDMNLQIAKMILERKLPCKVIGVDNGVEGIDILKSQRVNLVLLDIMMPDFDGIETLQKIRGDDDIKNVPVMMLTASGEIDDIQKTRLLGVKDYIKKPFLPADLVDRVKKILSEVHSEEILLLGDDEDKLQAMQSVIEDNFPHETLIATSTAAAEKILRESEIKLIIACADMKFIDGLKFLAYLAEDESFDKIPFAVTTADKIVELIDKINLPEVEEESAVEDSEAVEPPKVEAPPIVEEVAKLVVTHAEKKKLAKVVPSFIGYELDVNV